MNVNTKLTLSHIKGWNAYMFGDDIENNPFPKGSEEYAKWSEGYTSAAANK